MQATDSLKYSTIRRSSKGPGVMSRMPSEPDIHIDSYNLWNAKST